MARVAIELVSVRLWSSWLISGVEEKVVVERIALEYYFLGTSEG